MAQREISGRDVSQLELVGCRHCGHRVARMNLALHELRCDADGLQRRVSAHSIHAAEPLAVEERACAVCSYLNPTGNDDCEVCEAPLGQQGVSGARVSTVGRTSRSGPVRSDEGEWEAREIPVALNRRSAHHHQDTTGGVMLSHRRTGREATTPGAAPPTSTRQQSDGEPGRPTWACPRCTFENNEFSLACEMCRMRRTQDSRVRGARSSSGSASRENDVVAGGLLGAALGGLVGGFLSSALRDENESAASAALRGAGQGALLGALGGAISARMTDEVMALEVESGSRDGLSQRASRRPTQEAARHNYGYDDIFTSSYERLMEMFPPPDGPRPPASQQTVQELPVQEIQNEEQLRRLSGGADGDSAHEAHCTICLMPYEVGDTVKWLPCTHPFHSTCVDRWLAQSNSCPVCTHEVHT